MTTGQVEFASGCGRRAGRIAALAAVALVVVAVLGAAHAAAALPKLHVSGQKIRDAYGRQVLLRGVNDTSLTDQYQVNPDVPTVVPLTGHDYDQMQRYGFNVLRLAVSWSKLEPARGQINYDYIARIAAVVDQAAAHGMYTVINMHNAGWGKYPASKPGQRCPDGLTPSHGWQGAPRWATFINGMTTCHDDRKPKRPAAVKAAWTNFWRNFKPKSWGKDARGIQKHLVWVWGVLARTFARNPAVAGYDLLNEPDPGDVGNRRLSARDGAFDRRAIRSIRRSERRAHGSRHLIFFEPNLTWSERGLASHSPRPGFSKDKNLVFAPHLYGRDVHTNERPAKSVKRDLQRQTRQISRLANKYGKPWWIGEWSFSPFDRGPIRKLVAHTGIQDSRQLGSAWWQWRTACGSAQTFKGLDPTPTHLVLGNINRIKCPKALPRPTPRGWRPIVGRAYPRYAPGRVTHMRSRGPKMRLRGKSRCRARGRRKPKPCLLVAWVPNESRPKVGGRHLRHIRLRKQPGGWTVTAKVRRDYKLHTR